MMDITSSFNQNANNGLPPTEFAAFLKKKFGLDSATRVLAGFTDMGLPAPETKSEFLEGAEGCLVFLNKYGAVLRIEVADMEDSTQGADRINDSGWIIQPLGTIEAGGALIEVCPGCHFEHGTKNGNFLYDQLLNQGINFWDNFKDNIGILPFKSATFPEGVPVVVDRLAATRLVRNDTPVNEEWKAQAEEAMAVQDFLFGALRAAFAADKKQFWQMCVESVKSGVLTAGWNDVREGDDFKSHGAVATAQKYGERLEKESAPEKRMSFTEWVSKKDRGL